MHLRNYAAQRGTNLLELLLYTLVISILSAATIAPLRDSSAKRPLRAAAEELEHTLSELARQSTQAGRDFEIQIDAEGYEALLLPERLSINRRSFRAPVRAALPPGQIEKIRLYQSMAASPITITLQADDFTCRVIVSLRSRSRKVCNF